MESHFRRWVSLLFLFIAVACMGSAAQSAETTARSTERAYSPFDEPRPKIPQEIIADKHLDQKVKVFVKGRNLNRLLSDLSAKTGVKITASRKLWGEHPIIYFHNRPLRDVMTEISGLYGYRWFIGGKPGSYDYEMFEDISHAKRRAEAAKEMKLAEDRMLLDLAKMCMEDDKTIDRLANTKDGEFIGAFGPTLKNASKMLSRLGMELLREVLAKGCVEFRIADSPAEWQQAICDWRNATCQRVRASYEARGETPPEKLNDCSPADIASASFKMSRLPGSSGMPGFYLDVTTPKGSSVSFGAHFSWPFKELSDDEARVVTGREVPSKILCDGPLPDEPKITADKPRPLAFRHGLLIGDVVESIARQSGLDVVVDYHFRDETMEAVKSVPLNQTVNKACDTFGYTCQVDKQTLRFRFNKWFTEPVPVEPPADLIERLWAIVEQKGRLDISDLRQLATLTDEQIKWPGFKWMVGADAVAQFPATLRLWAVLSDAEVSQARSDAKLPVSSLSPLQRDRLDAFIAEAKGTASDEELDKSMLNIYTARLDYGWPDYGAGEVIVLTLPDRKGCGQSIDLPPPLKPEERKELAAQRKEDTARDVVELLQ